MYDFFNQNSSYLHAVQEVIGGCGSQPLDEDRKFLFEMAKNGGGKGYLLEIGNMFGSSLAVMAGGSKMMDREKVIAIDIMEPNTSMLTHRHYHEMYGFRALRIHHNLLVLNVADWVFPCGFDSTKAHLLLKKLPLRLLHIDGNHGYDPTGNDIRIYGDWLVSGGCIFVHDYIEGNEEDGLYRAVNELIRDSEDFTEFRFIEPLTAFAIKK